jgi:hypothetical protein
MSDLTPRSQRVAGKLLYNGYAAAGATSIYASPTNVAYTEITRVKATNVHPSQSNATIKIWVGASATDRFVEMSTVTLAFGESIEGIWHDGEFALNGLQLYWAQADRADDIALKIHGVEVSA